MCYCPTPTLHLNLALTGDGAFLFSLKKTHSVWFISVLNYGDTENVLVNHLLLVIPMSYPCHYTNLCPHKPHKHAHTHTHTHTHTLHLRSSLMYSVQLTVLCSSKPALWFRVAVRFSVTLTSSIFTHFCRRFPMKSCSPIRANTLRQNTVSIITSDSFFTDWIRAPTIVFSPEEHATVVKNTPDTTQPQCDYSDIDMDRL